jgi:MFS family permease
MDGAAVERETGFFASLHLRDFRLLWTSSMLSASGQWTLVIGRGWLMQRMTGSAAWVGIVTFAGMIPYLFATPIGGLLADRFERRRLAAAMQAGQAVATGLLAVLAISGLATPWEIVTLALIAGVGRAVETPATTAIVPNVVPQSYLLNAISLNSVATFGSRLLGPAAALILLDMGNVGGVFVMTASLYVLAVVLMLRVKRIPVGEKAAGGVWRQTADTWKYIMVTPMLPMVVLLASLHCGFTMPTDAVLPKLASSGLHGNGSTYDLLVMGFGAGTMVGTFALGGLRSDQAKGSLFLITGVLSGVTVALLALCTTTFQAFLVMPVMGAAQGMFMALGSTLVQEVVPDHLRGRVSSAYLMASGGLMSFGNLATGSFADLYGVRVVLLLPSLVFVGVVLALSLLRPGLRRLYRTGTLPEVAAAPLPVGA